ncbi:glutathione S-transferase [Aliidongia dinghuensis]|uniref:Glutathione S-transferase n=1 Tax=Aliidongia dinghuensis TaxID=1867774 RepID=A0A8J2YXA8_9PROT|nr:glutathione S-transferase [Aliidongia dinghuensis]GGF35432.1 glutathione S-transferase [Aliidongia dinghuensis]
MTALARPARPITLYGFPLSGHAHRVALFLSLLGLPHEQITVDLPNRAQKQPAFLALNPFGQVPVIDDDGTIVADSNAILVYLATRYGDEGWLPRDPVRFAEVQRWLSVAAGQITAGPCAARLVTVFGAPLDHERARTIAHDLFAIMNAHLEGRAFLVGDRPTIADVAGYSYIAHAPEGGVSLEPYPHIRAWLARIADLPGFVVMPASKAGLAA